jgi:ribonucleotide monophosphatase NagD (HAD superfamily)
LGTDAAKQRLAQAGFEILDERDASAADVVLVAHVDHADLPVLEGAARAVLAGARFLTGSYVPAYSGADGPIFSRGAMVTAAIAKASSRRPQVIGKPSRAAVREIGDRLGLPPRTVAVIGDDIQMDVGLGRLGGSYTVLVGSGITGTDIDSVPSGRRPSLVVERVTDLLDVL